MDFLTQTSENWTHSISAVASPWLGQHSSHLNQSQLRSHGFNKNVLIRTSEGDFVSKISTFEHYFRYCATWAKLKECTQNPGWMLVHCPVACDQCNVKCDNNNVYCNDWVRAGECTRNKEYKLGWAEPHSRFSRCFTLFPPLELLSHILHALRSYLDL